MNLEDMLKEWDDADSWYDSDIEFAESLIQLLRIELAGKEEVIKVLRQDIADFKSQFKG